MTVRERCRDCGQLRRVYARSVGDPLCLTCYRAGLSCTRCDHLGVGDHGLCFRCRLDERVDGLRTRAGVDRGARLTGYLDALAASPNPQSTLRWMQTPSFALVQDLVDGRLGLSHSAFDERQGAQGEGSAIAYMRAALVAHGALPDRDEIAAAFERWLARKLSVLPDGPDRSSVAAFASWEVARALASTTASHRGAPPPSAVKHARSQLRQAIALTLWLHGQGLALRDLRQDLLDRWVTTGTTTRRSVNAFIGWLSRTEQSARRLETTWPVVAQNPPIASDEQRLDALSELLADPGVGVTVRFAAAAVLLFAQPLTRVAAVRREDLICTSAGWQVRLGRRPVQAPAVLEGVFAELVASGPTRVRGASIETQWLLPGRKHGSHVTAEELPGPARTPRRAAGARGRVARPGALRALRCSPLPRRTMDTRSRT
jgi:hypothetical protein